jgi:hypothetical protein
LRFEQATVHQISCLGNMPASKAKQPRVSKMSEAWQA